MKAGRHSGAAAPPRQGASAARRAALSHLLALEKSGFWSEAGAADERWIDLPPNERALAERLVRGTLQNLRLLDHFIERSGAVDPKRTSKPLRWVLRLAVYQRVFLGGIPDYAIGQQAVEQARRLGGPRAAGFVNGALRKLLPELPDGRDALERHLESDPELRENPGLRYSVPDDIVDAYLDAYGREAGDAVLRSLNEEETRVWLRVNMLRATPDEARAALAAEGCETEIWSGGGSGEASEAGKENESGDSSPGVLHWAGGRRPWETETWSRGWITVQDLGAMPAVWLLDPRPGDRAADLCAAPGGKLGQMWERMQGRGELTGCEVDDRRRQTMVEALQRLYGGAPSVDGLRITSDLAPPPDKNYQAILLDAPCLALGLIRRHPEIRWSNRLAGRDAIRETQLSILKAAAVCAAPGARMLWVVCSPTRWELEDLIEVWLAESPDWSVADPAPRLPAWARPWLHLSGSFIRTRPDLAPVDAFGMVLLQRGA